MKRRACRTEGVSVHIPSPEQTEPKRHVPGPSLLKSEVVGIQGWGPHFQRESLWPPVAATLHIQRARGFWPRIRDPTKL